MEFYYKNPSILIGQVVKIPHDARLYTVDEYGDFLLFDFLKHNLYPDDRNSRILVSDAIASKSRSCSIRLRGYHLLAKQNLVVQILYWAEIEPIS